MASEARQTFGRGRLMDILEASRQEDARRPGGNGGDLGQSRSAESQRNGSGDRQYSNAGNYHQNNSDGGNYNQNNSSAGNYHQNSSDGGNYHQNNSSASNYHQNSSNAGNYNQNSSNAQYGQGDDRRAMNQNGGGGPVRNCYNCGQSGHMSRDCPQTRHNSKPGGDVSRELSDGINKSMVFTSRNPAQRDSHRSSYSNGPGNYVNGAMQRAGGPSGGGSRGCFNCGQEGHGSRDCPQLSNSGGGNGGGAAGGVNGGGVAGRVSGGGSQNRGCFNCGQDGHMSRDCPEPRRDRGAMPNDRGDSRRTNDGMRNDGMRGEGARGPRACYNCGSDAHMSRDCPEPRKERSNDSRPLRACYNCGNEGHMTRDCTEPRKERSNENSRPPRACFNCGSEAHMSRDCPEPKKERPNDNSRPPRACFNCGSEAHMSRECPEPKKEREGGKPSGVCFRCDLEGHMAKDCSKPALTEDGKPRPPPYIPPPPPESEDEIFSTITQGINFNRYDEIKVECTGQNIPERPMESFTEVKFSDVIMTNLRKTKYEKPTPIQKWAVPVIISGRDMMGCAQTGSGKTASFLLPMLTKMLGTGFEPPCVEDGCAMPLMLVLAPTRELVLQIFHETRKFSFDTVVRAVVAYGGVSSSYQEKEILKGAHIVIATPGRLIDFFGKKRINLCKLKYLVLDEVDRMLDMGFHTAIASILSQGESGMPSVNNRQTVVFSATIPEEVQKLAAKLLREDYIFITVGCIGSANLDIEQYVLLMEQENKRDKLLEIVQKRGEDKIIVSVEEKRMADFISAFLSQASFPTASIHGNLTQQEREKALRDFRSGVSPILVATNVAARGLDIPEVKHVINYDMPPHIEEYVHRIGRPGRCGNTGKATAFFVAEADNHLARSLVKVLSDALQEVPEWLEKMAADNIGMGGFSRPGGGKFGGRDMRNNRPGGYQQQSRPSHQQDEGRFFAGEGSRQGQNPAVASRVQPAAAAAAASSPADEDNEWD
uniref:RNA helicase n=1 Tax=Enchytraeus japonensis TaxID=228735 RepID=A7VM16_9ANNE|nr:Vasa-related protein [Enchytraeus japonensis]